MKKNLWPIGLILTFAIFISGTAGLVVMACSQKTDLVSPNYYEEEIKFQDRLDSLNRSRSLGALIVLQPAGQRIMIALPSAQAGKSVAGRIQLYCPSAARLDRVFKLEPDARGLQFLDATGLRAGLWKVRVDWISEKERYFIEESIVLGRQNS